MSMFKTTCFSAPLLALGLALTSPLAVSQETLESPQLGRKITSSELIELDLIASNESALPAGSGTAFQGREIYAAQCASCHGPDGSGGPANQKLVGGNIKSTEDPVRTVGSYWPHGSTLFDYVRLRSPHDCNRRLAHDQ